MTIDSELISQILYFTSPVLSLIILWLSRNENIFNSRKIQKYDVWDYQYTVFLYQAFFSIINPIIFLAGFFLAGWISTKVEYSHYFQLAFMMEIYVVILIVVYVSESEILRNKRKRLHIISSSISEEASDVMLNVDANKNFLYKINTFFSL